MARNEQVRSYIRNLGASLKFTAKLVAGQNMPALHSTIENNSAIVKSGVTYTKDFLTKKGQLSGKTSTMIDKIMKDINDIKTNAFDDLRTGKFNNFDREMAAFGDNAGFSGFDTDWGDGGGFDPFADPEDAQEETVDPFSTVKALKSSIKVSESGSNMRAKAMMESIVESSDRSSTFLAKTAVKLQSVQMNMYAQMHTESVGLVGNTNTLLTSILSFHNEQVVDHMNKQLSFFDNVLLELREIKEFQKKGREDENSQYRRTSPVGNIISANGSVDLKGYGKQIKNNIINMAGPLGSLVSLASSMKINPLQELKNNPLSFVTSMMVGGLMPKTVKQALTKLDTSMSGLFSAMIIKMDGAKNELGKPVKSFLANLLGIDISKNTNIDIAGFHKGAVSYNGRADKAITEVIPHLLSHILSALHGTDKVAAFNYTTGKYANLSEVVTGHRERIAASQRGEFGDTKRHMARSLSHMPNGNSATMSKDLDSFMDFLSNYNGLYNPLKDVNPEAMSRKGLNLSDAKVYHAIRAAFLNMPKHLQSSTSSKVLQSRVSGDRTARGIERELHDSGLAGAYSGLNTFHGPGAVKGEHSTLSVLKEIKQILIDGIIVYGGGTLNNNSTGGKGVLDRRSKHKHLSSIQGALNPNKDIETSIRNHDDMSAIHGSSFEDTHKKMAEGNAKDRLSENYMNSGFLSNLLEQKGLVNRLKMVKEKIGSPGRIISSLMGRMDNVIYRIIYGKETGGAEGKDGDPEPSPKKGIIGKLTASLNKAMDKSIVWIDKKIFTPLQEKFFGEKGMFTKFIKVFDPFMDKMKDMSKRGFKQISKYFMGEKDAKGFYTGGVLADLGNSFVDFSNMTRGLLSGGAYTKSDGTQVAANSNSVFSYIKNYSKSLFDSIKVGLFGPKTKQVTKEDGTIVMEHEGNGLFSGILDNLKSTFNVFGSLFKTKEGESPDDVSKTVNEWKKELKGFLPKGMAGGLIGATASMVLPGGPILGAMLGSTIAFAAHSHKFRTYLFGDEKLGTEGKIPKKYVDGFKKYFPSMAGAGFLGMISSAVLPGGPLVGLTLGAAVGYAAKSEQVQDFLFGKADKDGKILKDGLLGPQFKESLKKHIPGIGAGALLGLVGSAVLPGGPLVGLALGSVIGFAKNSESVKGFLFGKTDKDGNFEKGLMSPETLAKIKKVLPKGTAGALTGAISGSIGLLTPGGPLVGAIIGATLSIAGTSDKFKNFLFGDIDPETEKRKGGAIGKIRDFLNKELFDPFKKWRHEKKIKIQDWFQESFSKPFREAMQPFKQAMSVVGKKFSASFQELKESFKGAFNRVFEKSVGMPLGELVKKHITDPLKNILSKLFNALGKGLSKILTSPIAFMTAFSNSVLEKENKEKSQEEKKKDKVSLKDRFLGLFKDLTTSKIKGGEDEVKKVKTPKTPKEPGGPGLFSMMGAKIKSVFNRVRIDPATGDITIASVAPVGSSTEPPKAGPVPNVNPNVAEINKGTVPNAIPNPAEEAAKPHIDGTKHDSHDGSGKNVVDHPLQGQIDLTKYMTVVHSIDSHLKNIYKEMSGQLNGVGWNLEYIANILTDQFGKPSLMPTEMAKRGNKRFRGIFGRIIDIVKSPFKMLASAAHGLIIKPFQILHDKIGSIVTGIAKTVGKTIVSIVKLPFTIASKITSAIGIAAEGIIETMKMVGPAIGGIFKTAFDSVGLVLEAGKKTVGHIFDGIGHIFSGFGKAIGDTIGGMGILTKKVFPAFISGMTSLVTTIGKTVMAIGGFIKNSIFGAGRMIGKVFKSPKRLFKDPDIQRVEIVGGTVDTVKTVKVVEIIKHILAPGEAMPSISSTGVIGKAKSFIKNKFNSATSSIARLFHGSHAAGLDMVPHDDYIANLHEGEMVVPKHQAQVIRGRFGKSPSAGDSNHIANNVSKMNEIKTSKRWGMIGRAMRMFTSMVKKPDILRINMMSKSVQDINSADTFNEASVGLTHQIAVNTTIMASAIGGKDGVFGKLLGLLGTGLIPAITALLAGLKNWKTLLRDEPKVILQKVADKIMKNSLVRTVAKPVVKAVEHIAGKFATKATAEGVVEGAAKTAGSNVIDMAEHKAAKNIISETAESTVKSSGDNVVNMAEKKAAKEAIPSMAIDVVKEDGNRVMTAIKTFFEKAMQNKIIAKVVGSSGGKIVGTILSNLSKFAKNPEFIAKMLTGIATGTAKIAGSVGTLGLLEIGFGLWNATTALVNKGDAAKLFNVYEANVTPKMRMVASLMKTLLGVSYVFILELLNSVLVQLSGGEYNVLLMIANTLYSTISSDVAYAKLQDAEASFEKDAADAGKSKATWNEEHNKTFEQKSSKVISKGYHAIVNGVKKGAQAVGNAAVATGHAIVDATKWTGNKLVQAGHGIATGAKWVGNGIASGVMGAVHGVANAGKWVGKGVATGAKWVGDKANAVWNSDPVVAVRNIISGTWKSFTNITSAVTDGFMVIGSAIVDRVKQELGNFGNWIGKKWGDFTGWVGKQWDTWIVKPFASFGAEVKKKWNGLTDFVGQKWHEWIVDPLVNMGQGVAKLWNNVTDIVGQKWEEWVTKPLGVAMGAVGDAWTMTKDWVGDKFSDWVVKPLTGFFGIMSDGWNSTKDWVSGIWDDSVIGPIRNVMNFFKKGWGIVSDFVGGIFGGIADTAGKVWDKATDVAGSVGSAVSGVWKGIVGSKGKNVTKGMEAGTSNAGDDIRSFSQKIADKIKGTGDKSHASGLDAVPYDNYRAKLHKGEMVLPAKQANIFRVASGQSPVMPTNAKGPLSANNKFVNSIGNIATSFGKGGEDNTLSLTSVNSQSSAMINNVPQVSQLDPLVKSARFGKTQDTLGDSGCAPAVAAMAISSITKRQVSINELAKVAVDGGFKTGFNGTNPLFFKYLEKDYPVQVSSLSGVNMTKRIIQALQFGQLVILMGGGPHNPFASGNSDSYRKYTPFGGVPHYVLATGYDQTQNKITVNDPLSKVGSESFDLTTTLNSTTGAFSIRSRMAKSPFKMSDLKNFLPGMGMPGFGRGDDSDASIKTEFGYALDAPSSDFTVDDIRMVKALSSQYGVNPHLWLALVDLESSYNSKEVNSAGARGWGQVIGSTGKWLYEDKLKLGKNYDPVTMGTDKEINARMSMYYLSSLLQKDGDVATALKDYNGGEIGDRYPQIVAKHLKDNAGMSFSDVGKVNGTGVNSYGGSSDNGTDSGGGMAGMIAQMSSLYSAGVNERYGTDVGAISGQIADVFGLADPFNTGTTSSSGGAYSSDPNLSSVYNSNDPNEQKAKVFAGMIRQKYGLLSGDTDVHDFFAKRLEKLAQDNGKNIVVTSGWRGDSEQQSLIDQWRAEHPGASDDERKKWVADPGKGNHDIGMAADLQGWVKDLSNSELAKYGLWKPLSNEDWHFEPIETQTIGRANHDRIKAIFGNPFSPNQGYEQAVQGGFGKGGTQSKFAKDFLSRGLDMPTVGNGIGDADPTMYPAGAPSANDYATRTKDAVNHYKENSVSDNSETIRLLQLIADRMGKLVDNSDDSNKMMGEYLGKLADKNGQKSSTPIAIINAGAQQKSSNPFTDPTPATAKQDKSSSIRAMAAGNMGN
jgi:hypothetical protein